MEEFTMTSNRQILRNILLAASIIAFLSISCGKTMFREKPPKFDNFTIHTQSSNYAERSMVTTQSGNYRTTSTSNQSKQDFLEGTPNSSKEKLTFKNKKNLNQCKFK